MVAVFELNQNLPWWVLSESATGGRTSYNYGTLKALVRKDSVKAKEEVGKAKEG